MTDGYHDSENEDFSDLDEWLCEYVDGTIDTPARLALEEYMRVNPALAQHVQCLLQAKKLLCLYGCRHQAPHGLQPRLHERLARESHGIPFHGTAFLTSRLGKVVTLSAVAALILLLGNLPQRQPPEHPPRLQSATISQRPQRQSLRASFFPSPTSARVATSFFASPGHIPRRYPLVPPALFVETFGSVNGPAGETVAGGLSELGTTP